MRKVIVSLLFLAFAGLVPHAAHAMSAFAAGVPDNVTSQGVAFGTGYNYDTRDEAVSVALKQCRSQSDPPASTLALCKIIAYFDGECLGVALDPQAGTPGYGWAIGITTDIANDEAMKNCRATAGPGRTAYCKVVLSHCDTNAAASK